MSNRDDFANWLFLYDKEHYPVQATLDDVEVLGLFFNKKFCISRIDIWDIEEPATIERIIDKLCRKDKEYKALNIQKRIISLDIYKHYLLEKKYEKNALAFEDEDEFYLRKIYETLDILKERYSEKPAETFEQILFDNPDIDINEMEKWTMLLCKYSAEMFLFREGLIVKPPKLKYQWLSNEEEVELIRKYVLTLIDKYSQEPARSYNQLKVENPNIDFGFLNSLIRRQYNETAREYLINRDILENYHARKDPTEKFYDALNFLINKYSDVQAKDITQVFSENPDISQTWFEKAARRECHKSAEDVLKKWKVIHVPEQVKPKSYTQVQIKLETEPVQVEKETVSKPEWGIDEATILINEFYKMVERDLPKNFVASIVSGLLKDRAKALGCSIDKNYTSYKAISESLSELEFIHSKGEKGVKGSSKVFERLMEFYINDKARFDSLLKRAQLYNCEQIDISFDEEVDREQSNEPAIVETELDNDIEEVDVKEEPSIKLSTIRLPLGEWLQENYKESFPIIVKYLSKVDEKLEGASFAKQSVLRIDSASELQPYLTVIDAIVFDISGYDETKEAIYRFNTYLLEQS